MWCWLLGGSTGACRIQQTSPNPSAVPATPGLHSFPLAGPAVLVLFGSGRKKKQHGWIVMAGDVPNSAGLLVAVKPVNW